MLTQLRIVERDTLFVVQIRKQKFFTRRWWWQDLAEHIWDTQWDTARFTGIAPPCPITRFSTQKKAEAYCEKFLTKENWKPIPGKTIKTYNTGLDDVYWGSPPPMPECKPPKKP